MPRSSKHKSSKHGSRDTREYSDSEKDFALKDRKVKDGNVVKVSKDSNSGEKRKLDSKDGKEVNGSGNGEYSEEYGSSKRRKERSNAGQEDRDEGSRKSKTLGDSKSRRDGSLVVYGEDEEMKKSSGDKGDGKHKESGRKERKEGGAEKDMIFDDEEQRLPKQVFENTDLRGLEDLQSLELDNQLEKQMRKKRDEFGGGDKHRDDVKDRHDRRGSSRDDGTKNGRQKDAKRKDEKSRGKSREEMGRENKHRRDRHKDEHPARQHSSNNRLDGKHVREEKDSIDSRKKRIRLPESDFNRDQDHNCDLDADQDLKYRHGHVLDGAHHHDHGLDKDHDHDRDQNLNLDLDEDYERDQDGVSHADDRSAWSKEIRAKKRDLDETKSGVLKIHSSDSEKRILSSNRADSDAVQGKSQPRQAHTDYVGTSSSRMSSPTSNTHIDKDEFRKLNSEDLKSRDSIMGMEQRTKGMREGLSRNSKRGHRYKSMEKPTKIDDNPTGDLSIERSSSSKASPKSQVERSPSPTCIERKYTNRSGVEQNLEIEESERRNTTDARDFSDSADRLGQEFTLEKPLLDEFSKADLSFCDKISQGKASLIPPSPFRDGIDRPCLGSLDDNVRDSPNPRYRRNNDPGFGRGLGSSWRGFPNWTLPMPNGFVPFQHGPPPGGFQAMIPQFPSQPLFGVRPPMEVNHAGIPYHIPDAGRFSGHMRSFGWQTMIDSTIPYRFHGWEGNNGVFRDDHVYGGSDWDQNRHLANSRGWISGSETWKERNAELKKDLPSPASQEESVPFPVDDGLTEPAFQMSQDENNWSGVHEKGPETRASSFGSPEKVPMNSSPTIVPEKVPVTSTPSDNTSLFSRNYLSKLDISAELALPELYDQCMCLLNVERIAYVDSDASADPLLKNGSIARQKYAATLSKCSPFPAIDSCIFQRAIEHYKKQRVELPNREKQDVIMVSNQVQVVEPVPTPGLENTLVTVSTDDALAISKLDLKKVETLSPPVEEHLPEPHQDLSQQGQNQVFACSVDLITSDPSAHEIEGESLPDLREEDEVTFDQVISGDAGELRNSTVTDELNLVSIVHKAGGNMNSKAKITGFAHCEDEKLDSGDTLDGPLIFEDGTPKASDTLMPGSNESESVILSRIHHSPEITH